MRATALLLVGCYTSPGVPPPLSNTPPPITGDRWISRTFKTTQLPLPRATAQNQLETLTLEWRGGDAKLAIVAQHADFTEGTEIGPWRADAPRHLVGRVEEAAGVIRFELAGTDPLRIPCVRDAIDAAAATALRRPSPAADECGDTGRWDPAATTRIPVLRCRGLGFDESIMPGDGDWEAFATLAFAREPGVEWLHVNDDCIMQGGGWRAIAAGGSIARPR